MSALPQPRTGDSLADILERVLDVPVFRALVSELSGRHRIPLQLTGPWPAFHFSR